MGFALGAITCVCVCLHVCVFVCVHVFVQGLSLTRERSP